MLLLLARDFFPGFVESRNYKIQRVAHVGRKSAVVLSGTTEASYPHFFVGRGFESRRAPLENVELGKLVLTGLQSPREWKNRTRLDGHYFFYYPIPPEDEFWKKKRVVVRTATWKEYNTLGRLPGEEYAR